MLKSDVKVGIPMFNIGIHVGRQKINKMKKYPNSFFFFSFCSEHSPLRYTTNKTDIERERERKTNRESKEKKLECTSRVTFEEEKMDRIILNTNFTHL